MLNIGIDTNQGLVYEGSGNYGRAVWPAPNITPARFVYELEGSLSGEQNSDTRTAAIRFREDFYDPTTRIRRGRFYTAGGSQPVQWFVQPHPAMPFEMATKNQKELTKTLETYFGNPVWYKYFQGKQQHPIVLLGIEDRFTVWTLVNVEAISTGEDLVTLKARESLGILPRLDFERVQSSSRKSLSDSLDAFVDEARRSAPVSVIDRARDAASQALISYFDTSGSEAKDLGRLTARLEKEEKRVIAASACKIIARLHARAKPVEQAKRDLRPIREQDAELAIQCVGTLLCELGWAEWA